MHRFEKLILWLLVLLLLLGMIATLFFGRGKSRHGYGMGLPSPLGNHYADGYGGPSSKRG